MKTKITTLEYDTHTPDQALILGSFPSILPRNHSALGSSASIRPYLLGSQDTKNLVPRLSVLGTGVNRQPFANN